MILTLDNYQSISHNQHVLKLVRNSLEAGDSLVVSDDPVGKFVCTCDLGTVQKLTDGLTATDTGCIDLETDGETIEVAQKFRDEAAQHDQNAIDSFNRCDTDGFLSQWASGLSAELARARAQIAEDGGISDFRRLLVVGGPEIDAKLIEGQYGTCWLLSDEEADKYDRRFVPFAGNCLYCRGDGKNPDNDNHMYKRGPMKGQCKKCKGTGSGNSYVQKELGLVEGWTQAPAHAIIRGRGHGLSGSAWVEVVEVDEIYDIYKVEE